MTDVRNKFFWEKARNAGLIEYDSYSWNYVGNHRFVNELYGIVAYSVGHPDGGSVDTFEVQINGAQCKVIPIRSLIDDNLAIQVAHLLNQFGLKIQRYIWDESLYVVVVK